VVYCISEYLEKTDFIPVRLKSIAKKGLNLAQENTPTKDYLRRIRLM